jgi:hypothetical protein
MAASWTAYGQRCAFSSCESEYIALSQALRKVIPAMHLIQEMKKQNYHDTPSVPKVHSTLFEDNSGALTLAKAPAMRPRTKHINIKYHHFRSHVADGTIDTQAIRSKDQPADIVTKPLTESVFALHRHAIKGWGQVPTGEEHYAKSILLPHSRKAAAMAVSSSLPARLRGSAGIPPGKDSPAYSSLLSTHAEALGSTEKIKRQPTLKSRPSSKDPSSRKKMHVPAREGAPYKHAK